MNFTKILYVILALYAVYYLAVVLYDLFLKKDALPNEAFIDEEEIDISDVAQEFIPQEAISQNGENPEKKKRIEVGNHSGVIETGCLELSKLLVQVEDFAKEGEMSTYNQIYQDWKIQEAA